MIIGIAVLTHLLSLVAGWANAAFVRDLQVAVPQIPPTPGHRDGPARWRQLW